MMNEQLLRAARAISPRSAVRRLTVAGKSMTLAFLVKNYLDHMIHHQRHIGVDVGQIVKTACAYSRASHLRFPSGERRESLTPLQCINLNEGARERLAGKSGQRPRMPLRLPGLLRQ